MTIIHVFSSSSEDHHFLIDLTIFFFQDIDNQVDCSGDLRLALARWVIPFNFFAWVDNHRYWLWLDPTMTTVPSYANGALTSCSEAPHKPSTIFNVTITYHLNKYLVLSTNTVPFSLFFYILFLSWFFD